MERKVSDAVVRRLPGYYRYLSQLEADGLTRISSQELGVRMGLTASQIRQDINSFGNLGQQGYGYQISELKECIGSILGVGRGTRMIVAGAGRIGQAVALYPGFANLGFHIEALYDISYPPVGQSVGALTVSHMDDLAGDMAKNLADIAVIAVPADQAQAVAERVVEAGVPALWNFASTNVRVPAVVQNVQLLDSLLVLSYQMTGKQNPT